MTKVNAQTSLSKCSTVSACISQNRSVEDISCGCDRFGFARFWSRRLCVEILKVFTLPFFACTINY